MKAIIQAGGLGTRLRPVTLEIPKPLVPVKKRPIVNHIVAFLRRHGIKEVGIVASESHREDFERWKKQWASEFPDVSIELFFEEKPRGTFGYLPRLGKWLGDEPFVFINGDSLLDFDLSRLMALHEKHRPIATKVLKYVDGIKRPIGVVQLEGDYVVDFSYRSGVPAALISVGCYILDPKIIAYDDPSKDTISIETDVFPKLAKERKLCGLHFEECRFYDCGTMEQWEEAIREW